MSVSVTYAQGHKTTSVHLTLYHNTMSRCLLLILLHYNILFVLIVCIDHPQLYMQYMYHIKSHMEHSL